MYLDGIKHFKLVLSESSYSRLKSDAALSEISISKLIERIVLVYCEFSGELDSSINPKNNNALFDLFAANSNIPFIRTISKAILRNSSSKTARKHESFPRKREYNWTITNNARNALEQDSISDPESGPFISELIEEYAYMDYGIRERIMYRDIIKMIEKAIRDHYMVTFTNKNYSFYPVKIISEPDTRYNYIIGVTQNNSHNEPQITSHRLSNIDIKSAKVVTSNAKEFDNNFIESKMADRCIAYLKADDENITVLLTSEGETIYQKLVHNRPKCIYKDSKIIDGYRLYKFICTPFQAKVFFFAFGKDAKVIHPKELVEDMREFYKEAFNEYNITTY